MLEALLTALGNLLTLEHAQFLTLGVLLGLAVGIFPGLGGIVGLSLCLPFLWGMDPTSALALLIGLVAVIPTSDTFTSVLMGIPGSSASQATVLDGFPLAKKGEAARALGAAFAASLFGGLFGAVILTGFVLVARPIILSFGSAELFMLTVLGLSMVGVLAGRSIWKGLVACGLGLLLGMQGGAPATGEWRLTFGSNYLTDGVPLVVLALGIFAVPEIVDLLRRAGAISETQRLGAGWLRGLKDMLHNKWLCLRCAGLGALVGALPGLGGNVVDWIAYGHVVQTTRGPSSFGKGDIRGVLAPESANNAKEGGGLIPTLMFGIPGSGSMAVFLGGLILIGYEPGPGFVETSLDVTYTIVWSLALANVLGAGLCLFISPFVARLTTIPYHYLAPFMVMIICFAAYQGTRHWGDIIALALVGILGIYMRRFGWPRPALLIGFVLADNAETYLYQAVQFYDWAWVIRPGVLIIGAITLLSIWMGARRSPSAEAGSEEAAAIERPQRSPQLLFASLAALAFAVGLIDSIGLSFLGSVFPLALNALMLVLALVVIWKLWQGDPSDRAIEDQELALPEGVPRPKRSAEFYFLAILGLLALAALVGFFLAVVIFFLAFMLGIARVRLPTAAILAGAAAAFLAVMSYVMVLDFPRGLLQSLIELPWPLS